MKKLQIELIVPDGCNLEHIVELLQRGIAGGFTFPEERHGVWWDVTVSEAEPILPDGGIILK